MLKRLTFTAITGLCLASGCAAQSYDAPQIVPSAVIYIPAIDEFKASELLGQSVSVQSESAPAEIENFTIQNDYAATLIVSRELADGASRAFKTIAYSDVSLSLTDLRQPVIDFADEALLENDAQDWRELVASQTLSASDLLGKTAALSVSDQSIEIKDLILATNGSVRQVIATDTDQAETAYVLPFTTLSMSSGTPRIALTYEGVTASPRLAEKFRTAR